MFANWINTRQDVHGAFVAATSDKDNPRQLSCLTQAWREADAIVAVGVSRASQGLANEDVDQPLDDTFQKNLEAAFRTTYSWSKLDNRLWGSDTLLGRISREFARKQPSMFAVARVKSLARAQKSSVSKRQRLSDSFALEMLDGHGDTSEETDTLARWFRNLEVFANTWALAGCFDVHWQGQVVKYAHWENTTSYVFELRHRLEPLLLKYYPDPVLLYAVQVEEDFRAAAMQMARDDPPVPWGLALNLALKQHANIWDDRKDTLGPKLPSTQEVADASSSGYQGGGQHGGQHTGNPNPKGKAKAAPKGGGGGKGGGKNKSNQPPQPPHNLQANAKQRMKTWATSNHASCGSWICSKFNDQRGCRHPCPDGGKHICNATLLNGWGCEKKDHNRMTHNTARDGAVKTR